MGSFDRALSWPAGGMRFCCGPCTDAGRPPFLATYPWEVHTNCINAGGGHNGLVVCRLCRTSIRSDAQHAWCAPGCHAGPAPGNYIAPRQKNPCQTWADYQAAIAQAKPKLPAAAVAAVPRKDAQDPGDAHETSAVIKERLKGAIATMEALGHQVPDILVIDSQQPADENFGCVLCGMTAIVHLKRNAYLKYSGPAMVMDCKPPKKAP